MLRNLVERIQATGSRLHAEGEHMQQAGGLVVSRSSLSLA